jgi:hypothetical protein
MTKRRTENAACLSPEPSLDLLLILLLFVTVVAVKNHRLGVLVVVVAAAECYCFDVLCSLFIMLCDTDYLRGYCNLTSVTSGELSESEI